MDLTNVGVWHVRSSDTVSSIATALSPQTAATVSAVLFGISILVATTQTNGTMRRSRCPP